MKLELNWRSIFLTLTLLLKPDLRLWPARGRALEITWFDEALLEYAPEGWLLLIWWRREGLFGTSGSLDMKAWFEACPKGTGGIYLWLFSTLGMTWAPRFLCGWLRFLWCGRLISIGLGGISSFRLPLVMATFESLELILTKRYSPWTCDYQTKTSILLMNNSISMIFVFNF